MEIEEIRIPAAILIEREGGRVRRQLRYQHVLKREGRARLDAQLASFEARALVASS